MSNEGDKKQEKIIVLQKSIFSHLTSDTRLFIATKRNFCLKVIDTVDLEVDGEREREETLSINLLPLCTEIEGSPRQFQLEVCEQSRVRG